MKTKIIKKMLSTLLIASCLATTPSFVSAANDGLGDSKPAACAKNSQNELENDIKELDEVIAELKENIKYHENNRDRKIKEIDGKIKLYSKKLKKLEKKLNPTNPTRPRKKFKSLKTKDLFQIIDIKLKRITKKLNSSCQCDERLKKQFEFLKRKIERLCEERKSVESKFQENTRLERKQLQMCAANKSEKIKRLSEERDSVESKFQKNTQLEREQLQMCAANKEVLKEKASDLYEKSGNLRAKFISFSEQDKNKLSMDDRLELHRLPEKFKQLCEKDELNQEDIGEFNSLESTFKDLQTKIDAINSVEDLQSESLKLDQAQEKLNLWKKINSGSQLYNLSNVQGNLCWLYSATNVLNYYNNIKNETPIKKYGPVTEKYRDKMGFDAAKANINGNMQEFPQISDYLEKSNLGFLQMTISTRSNKKELKEKLMNTVKDLLKTHFTENPNPSPVIIHQPDHFITIAGYDQNKDQFLIVDSLNFSFSSEDAKVEWKTAQNAFHIENVNNAQTITLGFTSDSIPVPQSIILSINEQKAIIAHNLFPTEQQILTDDLKNMIKNY